MEDSAMTADLSKIGKAFIRWNMAATAGYIRR